MELKLTWLLTVLLISAPVLSQDIPSVIDTAAPQNCDSPLQFDNCLGCGSKTQIKCCEKAASATRARCQTSQKAEQQEPISDEPRSHIDCAIEINHEKAYCLKGQSQTMGNYLSKTVIKKQDGTKAKSLEDVQENLKQKIEQQGSATAK